MAPNFSTGIIPQLMTSLFSDGGWKRLLKNVYLDFRYGGKFLGGVVRSSQEDKGFLHTMNTDYRVFKYLFSFVELRPDDVIVDVGCGKGRFFNFLLSENWQGRLVGIEVNPTVAEFTRSRLKNYANVEVIETDVAAMKDLPGTVFYLYNPFTSVVMRPFLANLEKQWATKKVSRRPLVIYNNCVELADFQASGRWRVIKTFTPQECEARSGCAILEFVP